MVPCSFHDEHHHLFRVDVHELPLAHLYLLLVLLPQPPQLRPQPVYEYKNCFLYTVKKEHKV
jgi:hypothetical protein